MVKSRFIFFILCLVVFSCRSKDHKDQPKSQEINVDSLVPSPIVHDTLSARQIENIKKIQKTFAEVDSSTLEETIVNFKRDQHPDNEINIWLTMATAYERVIISKKYPFSIEKKQEVFKLILLRSMMSEEEAKAKAEIKLLNEKEIAEVFNAYKMEPKPITVQRKD